MTVFGKSLFETVLAGLDARQQEADDEDVVAPAVRGLNGGFVGRPSYLDDLAESDPATLFGGFGFDDDPALASEQHIIPPGLEKPIWLDRLTDAEIAEDLDLDEKLTARQLRERRRRFARDNHPDRVAPEYRAVATLRMTIANLLTDRALAKLEKT
ncbi:hypothetical protein JJB09_21720 [Rhizobium sp. KVB221]|uniref:Uncharacterized protein n=1 Tax=Rhizobium setariae TaxID=2801340 RepID=A0A936YQ29_9HYPH|nr:hypothetical protein [Rhizobium setariae]MBL0374635.1 hypothetical protein [Rhizobium setariae]